MVDRPEGFWSREGTQQRALLETDEGMAEFMTECFGPNGWRYDADADVWVTPNRDHQGAGRGFLVVRRGGNWSSVVLPERVMN